MPCFSMQILFTIPFYSVFKYIVVHDAKLIESFSIIVYYVFNESSFKLIYDETWIKTKMIQHFRF